MKYTVQQAISEFDAMSRKFTPRTVEKPNYLAVKNDWPAYLDYLEPLVSGRYIFSDEALNWVQPKMLKDLTGIEDDRANERALYFGVMAMSLLAVLKPRNEYPTINFDELAELWFRQSLTPIESLQTYKFFDTVSTNGIDLMLQGFLQLQVQPLVREPQKMRAALDHFETQFFSGILLGQIVQFLILRSYYGNRNA